MALLKEIPNDVWVEGTLPWVEGRCIPETRMYFNGKEWVEESMYPSPTENSELQH